MELHRIIRKILNLSLTNCFSIISDSYRAVKGFQLSVNTIFDQRPLSGPCFVMKLGAINWTEVENVHVSIAESIPSRVSRGWGWRGK